MLISLLYGFTVFLVLVLILGAISCFAELKMPFPDKYTPAFAFAALLLSAFVGAYIASGIHGSSGMLTGGLFGVCIVALLLLVSLALNTDTEWKLFILYAVSVPVTSAFAGVAGVNRSSDGNIHKHKKMKFKN